MGAIFYCDARHLGAAYPVLEHIALHVERIPADRGEARRGVKIHIAGLAHALHHVVPRADRGFHVNANRKSNLRATKQNLVNRFIEGKRAGQAVAKHFHNNSVARNPQVAGHEGAEILLTGVGSRLGDDNRANALSFDSCILYCLDHQLRQQFVLNHVGVSVGRGLIAAHRQGAAPDDYRAASH